MRNDIHRPSAIKPEEYDFVCLLVPAAPDLESIKAVMAERDILKRHQEATGATWSHHEHGGTCHVCGANAIYMAVYHHRSTNQYIKTGFDCAQKMDMACPGMNQFRRAIADAREAQAGKKKAIAILADYDLMQAWEIYNDPTPSGQFEERTICDIVGKLIRYGSISDKQVSFVIKLIAKILDRPIIAAQRQAEKDAAGPVPTGRVTLSGEVISSKQVERPMYHYGDVGFQTKLLIKLENGSKVYGNTFAGLQKGDKVQFKASVEASKDDPKFGFYKHPKLIESESEAAYA